MADSSPHPAVSLKLEATRSLHGDLLEKNLPQWLVDATPARRQALKAASPVLPQWYKSATPAQRNSIAASVKASAVAQAQLDSTMATFKDVDAFARPLLLKALKDQFKVETDVDKTFLCLRRALDISVLEVELDSFELLKLSMLQAALHNFEAWECKAGAYHKTSGFLLESTTPGTFEQAAVDLTVSQFMTLCRSLDIGAQYQSYLKAFFDPVDTRPEPPLQQHFIASQKAAMKAAAEYAVVKGDIEPADQVMILSVINGNRYPMLGDQRVWPLDLSLLQKRLTGCVYFAIGDRYGEALILYVPHDPVHPLKRYTRQQLRLEFKRLFTARDGMADDDPAPTAYQQFFSQFLPYDQQPYYFSQFKQKSSSSPWRWFVSFVSGLSPITRIKELPPEKPAKMEPISDPYLAPSNMMPYRGTGTFSGLLDLWPYLYEKHRDKILADARAHAVPTAEVDAKARKAKLAHVFEVGMLALNLVSMFVPVLGEVMMTLMAEQLLSEAVEASIEWAEGDKLAAKAHLIDLAENLAQIALMAGVGAAAGKLKALAPEPVLEPLSPVTLPNGQVRLWRPDLSPYQSPVVLGEGSVPNALGHYAHEGKIYLRQDRNVYETYFDDAIKQWRIKHPTDTGAYQPILESNGRGAWRHTLEYPLQWDRLTLLRRMGHSTEGLTDQQLLDIADLSGVSDNTLRKMHVDNAPPPPELADAMRLVKADAAVEQVIAQMQGSKPINDLYSYALPLVTQMPTWPRGRVLEVFEGPGTVGKSVRYGSERPFAGSTRKPAIKVTRRNLQGGELASRILVALDEAEVTQLLGEKGPRTEETRVAAFNKLLVDYARTRKAAIFDSLYTGPEPMDSRVRLLRRTCPGLSEAAAQEVLAQARVDELERFESSRRVPLNMLESARWYAREGRLTRAYAGLRSETIASADSRRLALHCLERLPGWPDTLRLEVRDTRVDGAVLDSIGPQAASEKKYLVKHGPRYQAFDDRGEALNSLPVAGDNFYASLMHALPDHAREGLGVPQVSQSAGLQEKIIAHADDHRVEAVRLLQPQAPLFKPPVRVNDRLLGYYASGRGAGSSARMPADVLSREIRQIYPGLEDRHVRGFLLAQQRAGKSARETVALLRTLKRQRNSLYTQLDNWVGSEPLVNPLRGGVDGERLKYLQRMQAADAIKKSWNRTLLAGEEPGAEVLELYCSDQLPPLDVDFSHVRELLLSFEGVGEAELESCLARFPKVEKLTLGERHPVALFGASNSATQVRLPRALEAMGGLKDLRLDSNANAVPADFSSGLAALTTLEALHLNYAGLRPDALNTLDLSALTQLKSLTIVAPAGLTQWPAFVSSLAQLKRLDLSNSSIHSLPGTLYAGHEQVWAGLSLDWSRFTRESFVPAYHYVKALPASSGHLISLDEMVRSYSRGELAFLMGDRFRSAPLTDSVMEKWDTAHTRMAAVELLHLEYVGIFRQFYEPSALLLRNRTTLAHWGSGSNAAVLHALEKSWRGAVQQRYAIVTEGVDTFEFPQSESWGFGGLNVDRVQELPLLPAGVFSHVKTLRLSQLEGVPSVQSCGFIRAFGDAQTLELSMNGLTELPFIPANLPKLSRLDLSSNRIVVTPQVQAQLNQLTQLEQLDLRDNPLESLDVSALSNLSALSVRGSQLQTWPTGAEGLPRLASLDLRDNAVSTLPDAVLANDDVLMKTEFAGNLFSAEGEAALRTARERVETNKGLPAGALRRFAAEPAPQAFPAQETAATVARHFLPLPRGGEGLAGTAGYAPRLQQLVVGMSDEQALQWLERLRQEGLTDTRIDAQISEWQQAGETLVRRLNGWMFTREVPDGALVRRWDGWRLAPEVPGAEVAVRAENRLLAMRNIRDCWQQGLSGYTLAPNPELSFDSLLTADLPDLGVQLPHVRTLNLSGVRMSAQGSNGFLSSFTGLNRLILSGNKLRQLPAAVEHMSQLERLELASNEFSDAVTLTTQLDGERLRWLDLSHNNLDTFDAQTFSRLETLDLSYNGLRDWPEGVLEARHLTRLNLNGNVLTTFPDRLLNGNHEGLVAGTDLTENILSLNSLEQLRAYSDANRRGAVMGMSRHDIDLTIQVRMHQAGPESGSESDSGSYSDPDSDDSDDDDDRGAAVEPLEELVNPHLDVAPEALAPWLVGTRAESTGIRTGQWNGLAHTDNHDAFFYFLSQLRLTDEFKYSRTGLTERVWEVVDAAAQNESLRNTLFINAQTHQTCPDGRILVFTELETQVYVHNALLNVPTGRLDLKGRALLNLSRQLFRLGRVEQLAETHAINQDRAEVHLQYRIPLTQGWPDGLVLPGRTEHMMYARPISGSQLSAARATILEAETSDEFYQSLISHSYWTDYLEGRYREELNAIDEAFQGKLEALEDQYTDRSDAETLQRYGEALNRLDIERVSTRNQRLITLSRTEVQRLTGPVVDAPQPGPASPQPGPSRQS